MPNSDVRLKLDMYANVSRRHLQPQTLAVPAGAFKKCDKTVVFIRKTEEFEPHGLQPQHRPLRSNPNG